MRILAPAAVLLLCSCWSFDEDLKTCRLNLHCVPKISPNLGICSGDNWCWQTPLPHNPLLGVAGSASNDVWAFGSAGTRLHYD